MKTLFLDKNLLYDGAQLSPRYIFLNFGLVGTSAVAFVGPCDVKMDHMIDGEDFRKGEKICGTKMLHFLVESFELVLPGAVFLQRLIASIVAVEVRKQCPQIELTRSGDDLYWNGKKFSISIATASASSGLIHFAVNVSNDGTPVPTCSLEDFSVQPEALARAVLSHLAEEYQSSLDASCKVKTF